MALIDGKPYRELSRPLTKVGSLLDANWIHPNRSAQAHLTWMAVSNHLPRSRVPEVLELVGLTQVADKGAGKFSLGMKQRLGIAGALLGEPEILLFDEPVNGLDPEGILWIRTFMRKLAEQGKTVFVSSHLLSEMALTADHLIVIGRGRLIADASTPEFIAASTASTVRVRTPETARLLSVLQGAGMSVQPVDGALIVSGSPIEQIGDMAGSAGITLHELAGQTGSLEEAFIRLTGESTEYSSHWEGAQTAVPEPAPATAPIPTTAPPAPQGR